MDRISTSSAYSAVLQNLLQAENAQSSAGSQLSSSEKATDLQGYGTNSETLMAMQATQTQVTGYLNNTQVISAKLATQNTALSDVASAAGSAIQAITQAIASGNGTTVTQSLQDALSSAIEGLNSTFNGEYLFSGGQVNTQAVVPTSLTQLGTATVSTLFNNDQRVTSSQLDQNTSISTGFLASSVGTPLFQALQAIEQFNTTNPLNGNLTTQQVNFLSSQINTLDTVQTNLNNIVAQNGQAQTEVTNAQNSLSQRQTLVQNLIGNVTTPDLAQASVNLQQAQLSIQAAGRVFQALNSDSLLSSLSAVPPLA